MTADAPLVIVGAGQAGAVAAAALRDRGYVGALVLVGREDHPPYERPPLSKEVLCGPVEPELGVLGKDQYRQLEIDWRAGVDAVTLDPERHWIGLADGTRLTYRRCLLATGGTAREMAALPRGASCVHYLRTLEDARRLRAALLPGVRVLLVGGGFLGLELASSARRLGAEVDVLEPTPRLLERFLPPPASYWLAAQARQAGVRLHLGAGLESVELSDSGVRARSGAGDTLVADLVVVAIGLRPETDLARQAGLDIDPVNGGIVIDGNCRTSEPDVYAAGDCASQHRDHVGGTARFESWQNANEQGRAAAAGMLDLAPPVAPYPWFWTDQFGCNLQMLGLGAPDLNYVLRGDPDAAPVKAIWLGHRKGVPVHALAVNAGGDLRQIRPLLEGGLPIDPVAFSEPSTVLRNFVKAARAAQAQAT